MRGRTVGSLIPHARAVRALMIPMIEAALSRRWRRRAARTDRRRPAVRQTVEQYAWPRSHAAQIAKRRLHRRHVFWRSGVSTTSERRHTPTGHARHTRGTKTGDWLGPSEHRGSHEGLEGEAPGPHLVCHRRSLRDRTPTPKPKRPWTLTSHGRADAPTARIFFVRQKTGPEDRRPPVQISTVLRGQRQLQTLVATSTVHNESVVVPRRRHTNESR